MNKRRFFEFFAGGGMARVGLEPHWDCAFANDFSLMKAGAYCANWGSEHFRLEDVNRLTTDDLPGFADLAWASFPCQDLSLAGSAAGLGNKDSKTRSGAFWAFWKLIRNLACENRAPSLIVLENVYGAITSNHGRDFGAICSAVVHEGYSVGALVIDARLFVPQSRPRLFIIGVRQEFEIPDEMLASEVDPRWHPASMQSAVAKLPSEIKNHWFWLATKQPRQTSDSLSDIIEHEPSGVVWHAPSETQQLINKMSRKNRAKLDEMQTQGRPTYGTVYRRTRPGVGERSAVMAELRDDGIAGCLRTPGGGSSRQFLIEVNGSCVRSRLLSAREAARLMGLSDLYRLPARYNDAYHVMGDGVVVPVVRFIDEQILQPILHANDMLVLEAAE
jgi:DNA (cytosine-5)-methyltransferase 1